MENVVLKVAFLEMTNGSPTLMLLLLEGQFRSSVYSFRIEVKVATAQCIWLISSHVYLAASACFLNSLL